MFCMLGLACLQKGWLQMYGEGIVVPSCTFERLLRAIGLQRGRRGKVVHSTGPAKASWSWQDHINRVFNSWRPNQLWFSHAGLESKSWLRKSRGFRGSKSVVL